MIYPIKLKRLEGGYEVLAQDGRSLGYAYRAPDQAWSYAPWVIKGDFENIKGRGKNFLRERRRGYRTMAGAVREICIANNTV